MANIEGALARVFVPDLDAAIPLYQELAEVTEVRRFTFRDVQLAQVGSFLLLAGNTGSYRDRVATILVRRLAPVVTAVTSAGGQIVEGPSRPAVTDDRRLSSRAGPGTAPRAPPLRPGAFRNGFALRTGAWGGIEVDRERQSGCRDLVMDGLDEARTLRRLCW
jgi:hypothetical protein